MKAYYQLTLAQIRIFLRNRQVLFWSLMFPFFFMFIFGLLFQSDQSTTYKLSILDLDQSPISKQIQQSLRKQNIFETSIETQLNVAQEKLKKGKIDVLVVFPQNFASQLKNHKQSPASVEVYYNQQNAARLQTALTIINSHMDAISKKMTHYQPLILTKTKEISGLHLTYLDFLLPGIIAMQIMSNNMNGVAGQIASWRERGVLRRMQGTTLKASTFIASQITARLILNGLQALLLLLIGYFLFDVSIHGSVASVILFIILGTLTFMSIGFIIASLAKTPESAGPIAGFLSFPLMFLGGVFFPISNMPSYLQPIIETLPITHLSTAFRETMNGGTPLIELLPEIGWLCAWLVVGFILATRLFKWE